jgi:plasmid stabilization system protein ParE
LEAEAYLNEYSPPAAVKFGKAIEKQKTLLTDNPLMYEVYEEKSYFRRMPLPYKYVCFYHVDESAKTVTVHRVLRGMRDAAGMV